MPTPTKGPRLGGSPSHERAILRNLSRSLIEHGRVVTTEAKARRTRPFVEKLITKARKGGLHNRRLVLSQLRDKTVVHRLFDEVAPLVADRPGGYTRILKLGYRRGDASPMAILELVAQPGAPEPVEDRSSQRRSRLRRSRSQPAPEAAETEAAGTEAATADQPEEQSKPARARRTRKPAAETAPEVAAEAETASETPDVVPEADEAPEVVPDADVAPPEETQA